MNIRIVIISPVGRPLSFLLTQDEAACRIVGDQFIYNRFYSCDILSREEVENIGINHIPSQEQFERAMPAVRCFNHV